MTNHTTVSATDFLEANEVTVWADLDTNQWGPDAPTRHIADILLMDWTYDGDITCDKAELVQALDNMRAEHPILDEIATLESIYQIVSRDGVHRGEHTKELELIHAKQGEAYGRLYNFRAYKFIQAKTW